MSAIQESQDVKQEVKPEINESAKSEHIFQGIGIVCGKVTIDESEGNRPKCSIEIEGVSFDFKSRLTMRNKLKAHLEKHPDTEVYLRVYPAYSLKHQKIYFQAIAFRPNKPKPIETNQIPLEVNQFLLAGIWQYTPKLDDQPVMSIYRNKLKVWEKREQVITHHLPVQGFSEEAYRFDSEDKTKRRFYRLQVSLNPQSQAFEFVSLLDSSEKIPQHVKRKTKRRKPDSPVIATKATKEANKKANKKISQMTFPLLQKTAIKLREAGFFEGKVSGKGVTKDILSTKVQDSLSHHPEAEKVLNG